MLSIPETMHALTVMTETYPADRLNKHPALALECFGYLKAIRTVADPAYHAFIDDTLDTLGHLFSERVLEMVEKGVADDEET